MARRSKNNQVLDALQAFGTTYGMAKSISDKSELADAAKANTVTEEMNGDQALRTFQENYVPQEGGAESAQEFLLQNPSLMEDLSGRKGGFSVGGETFDNKDKAQARAAALNTAGVADVLARQGKPEESLRLRQQARQGDLTEMQIKGAERGERQAETEEKDKEEYKALAANFIGSKIYKENADAMSAYEKQNSAYQEALVANKDNPAAAGLQPQKPALRAVTAIDQLKDASAHMQFNIAKGKVSPVEALQFQQLTSQVKKEVGTEAFKLLHSGDIQGAIKAFETQGDMKVPEGATVEGRKGFYEVAGQKVPTNELVVKLPNGRVQVFNGLQGMDALDAADKTINRVFKSAELGIQSATAGRANEEWSIKKPGVQAAADESVAQSTARAGLVKAIETGDQKQIETARMKAVAAGIKFEKPSLEYSTVVDQMGNSVVRTNKDTGEMDIVDRQSGATKNIPAPGKAANVSFSSVKEAERAAKEGKIKSGDRIIINGASGVWK